MLPSNEELITLLHSCPDLVDLRLNGSSSIRDNDKLASVESDGEVIQLRRLRILILHNVEMEMAAMLLARMRAGCLERLEVDCFSEVSRADQLSVLNSILTLNGSLQTVIHNNQLPHLQLDISKAQFLMQDQTSRQSFNINIARRDWLHAAPTTPHFHGLAELNLPLTLKLAYDASSKTDSSFLAAIHNLRTLVLSGMRLMWLEALEFLSKLQDGRLPCPQLQTIVVPSISGPNNSPLMIRISGTVSHLIRSRRDIEGWEGLQGDGGSVSRSTFMVLDTIGRRFDYQAMTFMNTP